MEAENSVWKTDRNGGSGCREGVLVACYPEKSFRTAASSGCAIVRSSLLFPAGPVRVVKRSCRTCPSSRHISCRHEKAAVNESQRLLIWWAPRESNPAPTDYAYPLRLSPPLSGLWSGLSLVFTTCPYSLYTFSLARASLGIATPPRQQRFPRI